jgi:hypothetical protein
MARKLLRELRVHFPALAEEAERLNAEDEFDIETGRFSDGTRKGRKIASKKAAAASAAVVERTNEHLGENSPNSVSDARVHDEKMCATDDRERKRPRVSVTKSASSSSSNSSTSSSSSSDSSANGTDEDVKDDSGQHQSNFQRKSPSGGTQESCEMQ